MIKWHVDFRPNEFRGYWRKAKLLGTWVSAYVLCKTTEGYWVQFDSNSPYRLVNKIKK